MYRRTGAASAFISVSIVAVWALLSLGNSVARAQPQPTTAVDLTDTEDDSSRLPWRGTSLTFAQSLNLNALSRTAQLSYNPTYAWSFIFEPRWYFNNTTYVSVDQRLSLELTDSDTTLRARRALLSDTILGIDTQFYETPLQRVGTLGFTGGAALIAPTSLSSRAATMTVGARARAGATLIMKHILHGAAFGVQGRYGHRFLRHNTVEAAEPYPCLANGLTAQNCDFLGSGTNTRDSFSALASASLELTETISLEALVWLSWSRGANLAPFSVNSSSYTVDLPDNSTTHWRNERYLVLGAGWTATDWLSIELSVIDYFSERDPQGKLRGIGNPLDLMVGLTTSVAFDRLYLASRGHQVKPMGKP
jgi:hypothetical protein